MTNSTTQSKKKNRIKLWSIAVWLVLWQLLSMYLKSDILLASPVKVAACLGRLVFTGEFWKNVGFTFLRINLGFLSAVIMGILLAILSYRFTVVSDLFRVPVNVIKAVPVASFIILVLIWVPSKNISVIISFLMCFPVIYTNISEGLEAMDEKMLEMAGVFRLPFSRQLRYIYVPQVIPYFKAACSLTLGLCWKAGIAAEVIGLPRGSVGERLYEAKIYLNTPEMFAWTVTIILVSFAFEKLVMLLVNHLVNRLEGK